jgi:hypothetical protein
LEQLHRLEAKLEASTAIDPHSGESNRLRQEKKTLEESLMSNQIVPAARTDVSQFAKEVVAWNAIVDSAMLLLKQNSVCFEILKHRPAEVTIKDEKTKELWASIVSRIKEVIKAGKPQIEALNLVLGKLANAADNFQSFKYLIGEETEFHFTIPSKINVLKDPLSNLLEISSMLQQSSNASFELLVRDSNALLDIAPGGAEALRAASKTIADSK